MKNENEKEKTKKLTEHFFRNEYGKMVSVIVKIIGTENVQSAEDIVQETLLKATEDWHLRGIPNNPQAWLYTTAKNLTLNILKRDKLHLKFTVEAKKIKEKFEELEFLENLDEQISDEQLKMMFVCCHPSISENSQIALILKILCGFSITEIANAFFTSNETIHKRLVRGRKQLRENQVSFEAPKNLNDNLPIVLKTIFLLFNEGYSPSQKNEIIRFDLCHEAIRLIEIIVKSDIIQEKGDTYSILALMYFNASRFNSRMNISNIIIEMHQQDRSKWDQELINKGIHHLNLAVAEESLSHYLILASISANHCIAASFEQTNWTEILSLYDALLVLEDGPITRLNRSVVLSKVKGNSIAIKELENLEGIKELNNNHLYHSTLAEFYKLENQNKKAQSSFRKAISLSQNTLVQKLLHEKVKELVPI